MHTYMINVKNNQTNILYKNKYTYILCIYLKNINIEFL